MVHLWVWSPRHRIQSLLKTHRKDLKRAEISHFHPPTAPVYQTRSSSHLMKLGDTNEDDDDDEDEDVIRSASLCSVYRTACALHFFWKTNMHCFIFSYRVASFYTINAIFKCELSIQIFFIIIIFPPPTYSWADLIWSPTEN